MFSKYYLKDFSPISQIIHSDNIKLFETLTSTNDWILEKIKEEGNDFLPCLAVTEHQTSGRGRGDHQWWSPKGALLFSLGILWNALNMTRRESAELSLKTAHAVVRTTETYLKNAGSSAFPIVSPPNDIYIKEKKSSVERKIAGILIESPNPHSLVLGIGVNINNSFTNAPKDLREKIVSFYDLTGYKIDRAAFLTDLLQELFA